MVGTTFERLESSHGPASITQRPDGIESGRNIRFADGSRGTVNRMMDRRHRRLGPGRPRWIYGKLDVQDDDVRFIDDVRPNKYVPRLGPYAPESLVEPSLELDIMADTTVMQRLQDDKFALVMNIFLSNDDFSKGDGAPVWSSSEKQAAI